MAAIVPEGEVVWGLQLPVQSLSTRYAEVWETEAGPDELAAVAVAAERAGAFYVAVCDHVAIPEHLVDSMGASWWHTLTTLGWLAARTERVHLLSHVTVAPYRHGLETAKGFATLDRLSGGRALLGVGSGHVVDEFTTLGLDAGVRGVALDEAIDVVRAVWSTAPETGWWDGPTGRVAVAPAPVRPGGPAIWVGGSSPAAMRRVVARGDGWLPQGPPAQGMRAAIAELRDAVAEQRPGERLDLGINSPALYVGTPSFELAEHDRAGSPDELAELMGKLAGTGADHVQIRMRARSASELCDQLEAFGAEVWPQVPVDHHRRQS